MTRLIADTFHADAVALWDAREVRMDKAGRGIVPDDEFVQLIFMSFLKAI